MPEAAALCATALLAFLSIVQIGAASGAPWGRLTWGGQHRVLPGRLRLASGVTVVWYAGTAAILLGRAGMLGTAPTGSVRVGAWVLLGFFALSIIANLASRSRAERLVMTPTCTLLAAATAVVVLGN
jgi:hypothetical protein